MSHPVTTRSLDVAGPAGPIRTALCAPTDLRRAPAVLFYPDIFQLTGPHLRLAERIASHGFLVLSPELYGRFEPAGSALDFEADRQRALDDAAKVRVEDADADREALLAHLVSRPDVDAARIYVAGTCFGGHLAFRAAYDARVAAVTCFYATTVHAETLGASSSVDTLRRARDLRAPLLLVWGSRDPHIPEAGRRTIHDALERAGARFSERLFDAEHAFMRDVGPRHQPEATDEALGAMLAHFGAS